MRTRFAGHNSLVHCLGHHGVFLICFLHNKLGSYIPAEVLLDLGVRADHHVSHVGLVCRDVVDSLNHLAILHLQVEVIRLRGRVHRKRDELVDQDAEVGVDKDDRDDGPHSSVGRLVFWLLVESQANRLRVTVAALEPSLQARRWLFVGLSASEIGVALGVLWIGDYRRV